MFKRENILNDIIIVKRVSDVKKCIKIFKDVSKLTRFESLCCAIFILLLLQVRSFSLKMLIISFCKSSIFFHIKIWFLFTKMRVNTVYKSSLLHILFSHLLVEVGSVSFRLDLQVNSLFFCDKHWVLYICISLFLNKRFQVFSCIHCSSVNKCRKSLRLYHLHVLHSYFTVHLCHISAGWIVYFTE